jgi:hypothetical protein
MQGEAGLPTSHMGGAQSSVEEGLTSATQHYVQQKHVISAQVREVERVWRWLSCLQRLGHNMEACRAQVGCSFGSGNWGPCEPMLAADILEIYML